MTPLVGCDLPGCIQPGYPSPWWQAVLCPDHLAAVDQHGGLAGINVCGGRACPACHCWTCQTRARLRAALAS